MSNHDVAGQKNMKGVAVSSGIIIGKAHLVDRTKTKILYKYLINDEEINSEVERFENALLTTEQQLVRLKNGMPEHVKEHSFILDSHLMILKDSMLKDSTIKRILDEKINVEWALKKSIVAIRQNFEQIDDDYISNRINDVEYVTERIFRNLSGKDQRGLDTINQRVIIVAHDLSPADTTELNVDRVKGFITNVGGRTSHTAIMAQALDIPAVVGLEAITAQVSEGDILIVDGSTGNVIINPDDNTILFYEKKKFQHEEYKSNIARVSHLPAESIDGHRISITANIEFLEEVAAVKSHGGKGIGLYRTEFLYLRSKGIPDEEELFEDYREVAEIIAPNPVTIRTLDLGGDKFVSKIEMATEMNPALGLRGIRLCLKLPDIFKSQLRAILRASAYGNIQLMFPMISGLQEILDAEQIMKEVKDELDHNNIEYDHDIKTGIMIEVPSAVTMAETFAQYVDFFSIGTNDLIQYALAIDRINEHMAFMYQPFHPAIIKMIKHVVDSAKKTGISVSLCGEMAGDPLCLPLLIGLGIDELSMNSSAIPLSKKVIRSLSIKDARSDLKHVITLGTSREVRTYLLDRMKALLPELVEKGYLHGM